MIEGLFEWPSRRGRLLVVGATLACLAPFLGKAFHIDDPVYVEVAQQILRSPLDFFGSEMNWHGWREPVAAFNKNPPGLSFYLALVGGAVGFEEWKVHLGMLLPALALVLGTAALAQRLSSSPWAAALALLTMPAVLVSATTVMPDVLMLALWCWAVVFWWDGLGEGGRSRLAVAALLAGLCPLVKYNGMAVLPLLALVGLVRRDAGFAWIPFLLIPLAMLLGFDAYMRASYGQSPLLDAGNYALSTRPQNLGLPEKGLIGLSFFGGSLLTGLFMAPFLFRPRALAIVVALTAACAISAPFLEELGPLVFRDEHGGRWGASLQLALFVVCGGQWLVLLSLDAAQRRDSGSWLLGAWIAGVFVFAAFLNWSINARAVLPAAPAAAVLLIRRLEKRHGRGGLEARPLLLAPLAPALGLALGVAWADTTLANSARDAAHDLLERHASEGARVWFRGGWGFQHYAELGGAQKIDERHSSLSTGDIVILPANNTDVSSRSLDAITLVEQVEFPVASAIATMAPGLGAGFYTDLWGPLPFAFGRTAKEVYHVVRVNRAIRIDLRRNHSAPAPSR
jgi:4-amino-4-deoxy-L-arabinose transferase-like glycosyltransferase